MNTISFCTAVRMGAMLLCVFHSLRGLAATFSLNPGADAFVTTGPTGNLRTNNYGSAGALSVAAPGLPQGEFQSVLQFSLSGAKSAFDSQFGAGQWAVQSVTLQLTATSPNNGIFNASAAGQFGISLMLNNGWIEGTGTPMSPTNNGITFSTLPGFESRSDEALGSFSFNGATSGATNFSLTLSPTLSSDILAGSTASLRMFADDSSVSYLFDSRNIGTSSARPLLTITAIPEPSALGLSALGLLMFTGWGFGRKMRRSTVRGPERLLTGLRWTRSRAPQI